MSFFIVFFQFFFCFKYRIAFTTSELVFTFLHLFFVDAPHPFRFIILIDLYIFCY